MRNRRRGSNSTTEEEYIEYINDDVDMYITSTTNAVNLDDVLDDDIESYLINEIEQFIKTNKEGSKIDKIYTSAKGKIQYNDIQNIFNKYNENKNRKTIDIKSFNKMLRHLYFSRFYDVITYHAKHALVGFNSGNEPNFIKMRPSISTPNTNSSNTSTSTPTATSTPSAATDSELALLPTNTSNTNNDDNNSNNSNSSNKDDEILPRLILLEQKVKTLEESLKGNGDLAYWCGPLASHITLPVVPGTLLVKHQNTWKYYRECIQNDKKPLYSLLHIVSAKPVNSLKPKPSKGHIKMCLVGTVPGRVVASQEQDLMSRYKTEHILLCVTLNTQDGYLEEYTKIHIDDPSCVVVGWLGSEVDYCIDGFPYYQDTRGFMLFIDSGMLINMKMEFDNSYKKYHKLHQYHQYRHISMTIGIILVLCLLISIYDMYKIVDVVDIDDVVFQKASKCVENSQELYDHIDRGEYSRALFLSLIMIKSTSPVFQPYICLPVTMHQSEHIFGYPYDLNKYSNTLNETLTDEDQDFMWVYRCEIYQLQYDLFVSIPNDTLKKSFLNSNENIRPVCFNPISTIYNRGMFNQKGDLLFENVNKELILKSLKRFHSFLKKYIIENKFNNHTLSIWKENRGICMESV